VFKIGFLTSTKFPGFLVHFYLFFPRWKSVSSLFLNPLNCHRWGPPVCDSVAGCLTLIGRRGWHCPVDAWSGIKPRLADPRCRSGALSVRHRTAPASSRRRPPFTSLSVSRAGHHHQHWSRSLQHCRIAVDLIYGEPPLQLPHLASMTSAHPAPLFPVRSSTEAQTSQSLPPPHELRHH
jgi:hypothetical protein